MQIPSQEKDTSTSSKSSGLCQMTMMGFFLRKKKISEESSIISVWIVSECASGILRKGYFEYHHWWKSCSRKCVCNLIMRTLSPAIFQNVQNSNFSKIYATFSDFTRNHFYVSTFLVPLFNFFCTSTSKFTKFCTFFGILWWRIISWSWNRKYFHFKSFYFMR